MMKLPFRSIALACVVGVVLLGAAYLEFRLRDLSPQGSRMLVVARGTSAIDILESAGRDAFTPAWLAWLFARMHLGPPSFKAGVYDLLPGTSLHDVLAAMHADRGRKLYWQLVEGQTLTQVRQSLAELPFVQSEVARLGDPELLARLQDQVDRAGTLSGGMAQGRGREVFGAQQGINFLEGVFFPDRYRYVPGMSDLELLALARKRQLAFLAEVWSRRPEDYPLHSAGELLTLASLIEKETGRAQDRQRVAAVFLNRIQRGMRLQSDPTVIYGRSSDPLAPITRTDLRTDHPFNTYTRYGLPPTPIAIPGKAALEAAIQPSAERSLYFVARGDGSSEFSESLQAHNAAVQRYLRSPQRSAADAGRRS